VAALGLDLPRSLARPAPKEPHQVAGTMIRGKETDGGIARAAKLTGETQANIDEGKARAEMVAQLR